MSLKNQYDLESTRPLPLWPILRAAFQFPWEHIREVGQLLIIPIILSLFLMSLDHYLFLVPFSGSLTDTLPFVVYLPLLDSLVFTFFAVSYHRLILIGPASISGFGVRGWTMRETRFFLWLVAVFILGMLAAVLFSAVLGFTSNISLSLIPEENHPIFYNISTIVTSTPFIYVVGRLSLILPALAIDRRPNLSSTLSLSKANGWRVALLIVGSPLVFWGLYHFEAWTFDGGGSINGSDLDSDLPSPSPFEFSLEQIIRYLWFTIEVAILSFTYRELSSRNGNVPPVISPVNPSMSSN